ncbi:hypothetical protein [Aquirufa ecclesiirivi]|uniref:hypothetical protein n=1 Tax=Aquirufa ecclesiirivi TaxID=2715124 RepID=UPI00140DC42E|nr:hypothetical protein [Aquirufa ecclesiirivi]NHC48855.1 hypothetical protein [Aquirufa ecclesiirivi]
MQQGKKFLSDLKLYSDYYKWLEPLGRYERWEEACESIMDGHRKQYSAYLDELEPYLESALESMQNQTVLASQRNLQFRFEQIQQHNTRMYNCTSGYIARNRIFQEIFYLGLSGCGFGGGLLIPMVDHLSRIQKRIKGTKTFVVEDNIEGWADALGALMSSYFVDKQPFPELAGFDLKFDYSQIRPKGAYIKGGYKAPGSEGLKQSLEKIEDLLEKWISTEGEKIRPILAFDIICHASDAVLSGGVRRSALNMIVDPNDQEMIHAKTGNWRQENPQRGRSNNSVILLRNQVQREQFDYLVSLNDGANDIGFVFANSWFDMFNPCFEIVKIPILFRTDFSQIAYEEVSDFIALHQDKLGIQGCNLCEINAEKCDTEEAFFRACMDAAILGTLQAGYTSFPYLGSVSEQIFQREALLGVSITGWMNNTFLFNAPMLQQGAQVVKDTNRVLAEIIGINPAARTTCVKPSGNASVVLGTASGIHPEHAEKYFRIMQLNKESTTANWLVENMPFLLEESVWSNTKSDFVVFVPILNPPGGLFKKDMKGVKHLEMIQLVQENWVNAGTNRELCAYPHVNHNTSCTVIMDNKEEIIAHIWQHRDSFTAVSFISDYGDKDFNQAPFTSVMELEELVQLYGKGAIFASGLIVDGLHYFENNLWHACDLLLDPSMALTGTREQVLLRKYWLNRANKFAKNYFNGDLKQMIYCIKDVHLFHKWETVTREFKEVNFGEILDQPQYKDIRETASMACSGGSCEITHM